MEYRKEDDMQQKKNDLGLSVPQFGEWDLKNGQVPDYSLDFSKIRENRKQNKRGASRPSMGNDNDLVPSNNPANASAFTTDTPINRCHEDQHSASQTRRRIFSCFNCCARA